MDLLEGIYTRRSVRKYTEEPVEDKELHEIVKAGTWAPSGLNNQPWRFVIVKNHEVLEAMAKLTRYDHIVGRAAAAIAVFLDTSAMYHEVKDHQAMGACIQNMLLAAHALGLGAVWLGEILNKADRVKKLLGVPDEMELMAVVALGHPASRDQVSRRKGLSEVVIKEM
jgi:nitroreductase